MTVEELKVRFTASTEEFKAKTDEMKQKLSDVGKIGEKMQKTIDLGMKSSSEKTKNLAKNLSSIGERLNTQIEKLKDAASSVNFYADKMDELKAKSQQQTAAIEAQKAKVAELKNAYARVKEITEKFSTKIPLSEQFEEAEKQANLLDEKIRMLQKVVSSVGKNQKLVFVGDELMSIDKAREKISQLISEQEEASRKAGEIEKAMSSIGSDNIKFTSNEGMKQLKTDISEAEKQLASLKSEASKTNSEISSTAQKAANSYKKLEAASSVLDKLKRKTAEAEEKLKKATTVTQRFKDRINSIRDGSIGKVTNAFKKAGSVILGVISKILKIPAALKRIGSHAKSSTSQISKIPSLLKKITVAAIGLKLIKGIFGQLRSVVSGYISQNEALNARVEGLKNAFGQMLAPAIEIVIFAFEKLMPYLLAIGEAIMNVLSSLSVFSGIKKTSSAIDGVTDSTKALSEAQRELYGFDKITKQSDDKNSSGTSAPTYKAADIGSVDDIISKITESINKAMKSIDWDSVKQKAVSFASEISSAFNQLFSGIDWEAAGKTVGEGLNTITVAMDEFFTKTDFENIGKSIATMFSNAFSTVDWSKVGKTFSDGLNSLTDTLHGFVTTFDWKELGTSLFTGLNSAVENFNWSEAAQTISEGIKGLLDSLIVFLEGTDWQQLGGKVADFIGNIDWSGIVSRLCEGIGAALGSLGGILWGLIQDAWGSAVKWWQDVAYEDGQFTISGLLNGIWEKIKDIGTWIKEHIFQPFIDGFKKAFGIASPAKEMVPMGEYIIDGLKNGIGDIWEKVKEKFTGFLDGIKTWFTEKKTELEGAWDTFTSGIGTVVATVKENYEEFKGGLKAKWDNAISKISDKVAKVTEGYTSFKGGLKAKWSTAVSKINDKSAKVKEGYASFKGGLKTKWSTAISKINDKSAKVKEGYTSFKGGLKAKWSTAVSKISDKAAKVIEGYTSYTGGLKAKWDKAKYGITSFTATVTAEFSDKVSQAVKNVVLNIIGFLNSMIEKLNSAIDHISDNPKWDIPRIQTPQWVTAMAKGGIVDRATPSLIGEDGKEAVMPLENNTGWIDELARRISLNINPDNSPSASGKTPVVIPIYIGTRKITDVFIDDINQRTLTTGRCPIRI